jgi:LmbE family N-acetylglucosaminyl deacetylase
MIAHSLLPTRKDFLLAISGASVMAAAPTVNPAGKVLIVVAHPDDEYACAASIYRLVRERGWVADQVIITNGEAGYRYSALAEAVYGVSLVKEANGRAHLPAIRREEAERAGRLLGIRHHHFLGERDSGFGTDAAVADASTWDQPKIREVLSGLLKRERYDVVFVLLPTPETHGHHRAATLLTLETIASLPEEQRPEVFGVEARGGSEAPRTFAGLSWAPLTKTTSSEPEFVFDRTAHFGYQDALSYQIVVNWVIAEHKSQGLFQTDFGRHDLEEFWRFAASANRLATSRRVRGSDPLTGTMARRLE